MKIVPVWIVFCVVSVSTTNGGRRFKHQSRSSDVDDDAEWELNSRGLVSHIVNLDVLPDVSVAENSKGEIIVNLRDTSVAYRWQKGWYVISTNVRQRHGLDVKHVAIVRKIQRVNVVSHTKVKVEGIDISALDLLQEAQVFLRYPHITNKHSHRQKRYVSNLLSDVLDKISFHAIDADESINFNFDPKTGKAIHAYNVYKEQGKKEVKVEKVVKGKTSTIPRDVDFRLTCKDCFEVRHIGHTMDLNVERRNTTAVVKMFLMQSDVNTIHNVDFDVDFRKALGVKERLILDKTPATVLRTIPVAKVNEKLPPIQLVISYDRTVYLEVNATSDGPINFDGKFHVQGNYTATSTETSGHIPRTDLTTADWSSSDKSFNSHSVTRYNFSMALYQEVTLQTSVQWSQHDVSLVFTPPEIASFRPVLYARTTEDEYSRCEKASLIVDGMFTYDKSDFVAKAFHKTVWDLGLVDTNVIHKSLIEDTLSTICSANCAAPVADVHGKTMEAVCGAVGQAIVRGDGNFNKLTLIGGDFILFRSEEKDSASWCGTSKRPCRTCVWSDHGDSEADVCADRLMTSTAAASLTTLGLFAAQEWPNRKLVVLEAWDEPTSDHPQGNHGASSLHYSGRALQVALTTEHPNKTTSLQLESSAPLLKRLAELGACAGFPFFDVTSGHVEFCVHDGSSLQTRSKRSPIGPTGDSVDEGSFLRTMNETVLKSASAACKIGRVKPSDVLGHVINPPLMEHDLQYRLIQYPYEDVIFKPEGSPSATCYQSTRRCKSTCKWSDSTEHWDWCQTRVMTPRMAIRLRRLAAIVKHQYPGAKLSVGKPALAAHRGSSDDILLEMNGRKLQITRQSGTTPTTAQLHSLATCAGFDYIDSSKSSYIDVYVKLQDGYKATIVPFPVTTVLAVGVQDEDYAYPPALIGESRKSLLFDGFNKDIALSQHFKISDFKHSERRFFRLDASLVDCLELVVNDLGQDVRVVPNTAYRSHSINLRDMDHRHSQEKLRYQAGQAMHVKPIAGKSTEDLVNIGQSFLRSCSPTLRLQARGLGIGCHGDSLYIDIRPMTSGDVRDIADVWNAGNEAVFDKLHSSMDELRKGGPAINPLNQKRTCKTPRLGEQYAHYSFNTRSLGFCFHDRESQFCHDTREYRHHQADKLRDDLMKVAGTTMTRNAIESDLQKCVLDNCGGCPGKGTIWNKKVSGCVGMVHTFLRLAKNQFKDVVDKAAFFNIDNAESSVHSLACHDGHVCLENTQLYSLIMPLMNSKYQPNPQQSREELLYSGDDNPLPLISLVEQEFAKQVSGVVKVYIESEADMASMRDVLKILMIYNRDVTEVEFHLTDTVDQDNVMSALQRKLEYWSGTACPRWSRFAVAAYSVHDIPHHRRRRSLERSRSRNKVKKAMKEWELDWIKKM
ncbi:uncharacterized protein [Haliotis asinina]|uniref:uncharacterized protein n=1 Tax=Haliotis asinina TaxID=109174 RepID=UPI003532327A